MSKNDKNQQMKAISIEETALFIRTMPTDQAVQVMKSKLTGQPVTSEIKGSLVVVYINN